MSRLTRDDLSVIEGDARVSCGRLAEALGFSRRDELVRLAKSRMAELEDFGRIFRFEAEKSGRGRRAITYLFNEHQAVALCMWASTAKAREARMQIVEVFVAWRRGDLYALEAMRQQRPDPITPPQDAFELHATRAETTLRQLRALSEGDEFLREITHLDIWPSKRRPAWWHDLEVREFLMVTHRQMSTLEAERQGQEVFGSRCPKKSTICDFWIKLDKAKTGKEPVKRLRPGANQIVRRKFALEAK